MLIEVNCETDFVARNEEFRAFVHDVAMHIAAASPAWVSREDIPEETEGRASWRSTRRRPRQSGKPDAVVAKIAEGKLNKWYSEVVLLEQEFVKDPEKTIDDLRRETGRQDRREHRDQAVRAVPRGRRGGLRARLCCSTRPRRRAVARVEARAEARRHDPATEVQKGSAQA